MEQYLDEFEQCVNPFYEMYNVVIDKISQEGYTICYLSGEVLRVWSDLNETPDIVEITTEAYGMGTLWGVKVKGNTYILSKYNSPDNTVYFELHKIEPGRPEAERITVAGYAPIMPCLYAVEEHED